MTDGERATVARRIIDTNAYLTIATADREGTPWASPVWFAHDHYQRFLWVSRPDARHSCNIALRPEIAIVIFDSTVPTGTGQAVYAGATARLAAVADLDVLIATYAARSRALGGGPWDASDVTPTSMHRLYVADATTQFILDAQDRRIEVRPDA